MDSVIFLRFYDKELGYLHAKPQGFFNFIRKELHYNLTEEDEKRMTDKLIEKKINLEEFLNPEPCHICQKPYNKNNQPIVTYCYHWFHTKCFKDKFINDTCPKCSFKNPLNLKETIRSKITISGTTWSFYLDDRNKNEKTVIIDATLHIMNDGIIKMELDEGVCFGQWCGNGSSCNAKTFLIDGENLIESYGDNKFISTKFYFIQDVHHLRRMVVNTSDIKNILIKHVEEITIFVTI